MKNSIFIVLALLCFHTLYAQITVKGKVIDKETKNTLPGATIYLTDLKKGVVTDASGTFELNNLPKGNLLFEIRFIGYNILIQKIILKKDTLITFELSPSHTELNEVIITGTSSATERKINPVQSISINELELKQSTGTNIIKAISNQPGVEQISMGNGISKPVIRGLGYNRVVVLNDNIRQEGQQWGDEHGIEIDGFSIGQVEIIKGPGSLVYGSDAMAGVVHFISPKPLIEGNIETHLKTEFQSNNLQQGYSLINRGNKKGFYWTVQGTRKLAGNYQNKIDGEVYNSGFNEWNGNATFGLQRKWGYNQITLSTFNQNLGIVEGDRDSLGNFTTTYISNHQLKEINAAAIKTTTYGIIPPKQQVNHHKFVNNGKFFLSKGIVAYTLGFQNNIRKEIGYHTEGTEVHLEDQLVFDLKTANYDLSFVKNTNHSFEYTIGTNGFYQNNTNKGLELLIPDYRLMETGIFGLIKKQIKQLNISGGIRYNLRMVNSDNLFLDSLEEVVQQPDNFTSIKFNALSKTFQAVSYALGFTYSINQSLSTKINWSSGFRAPTINELTSNGSHEGSLRYEIGNPNLKPETSQQIDVGLLFNNKHLTFEIDGFANSIQNFIYAHKVLNSKGLDSIVVNEGDAQFLFEFTQNHALLYGGEFLIDIHPHPLDWLHVKQTFSYVRGLQQKQPDSLKNLPFIPAPKYTTEIKGSFDNLKGKIKNIYSSIQFQYYLPQNNIMRAFNTETKTPDYGLLNFVSGFTWFRKEKSLMDVTFIIENLTDKVYQSHLSRLKYAAKNPVNNKQGVFNPGRNFILKVAMSF
ncbi:MAG: TonB-dependent receptor [Vicingaceae bacterium]